MGVAAVIGAVISAVGTVAQMEASSDAADAQREAEQAKGRMASVEAQRERVKQAREARRRRGEVIAAGQNSGMGMGTSGIGGSVSSISSQAASNIGHVNQMETFAQQASAANQAAANAQASAANWQGISSIGGTIMGNSEKIEGIAKNMFGTKS